MTHPGDHAWRPSAGDTTDPKEVSDRGLVRATAGPRLVGADDGQTSFADVLSVYNGLASEYALGRKSLERTTGEYESARDALRRLLDGIDQAVMARTRLDADVLEALATRAGEVRHGVEALQASQTLVERQRARLREMTAELATALNGAG